MTLYTFRLLAPRAQVTFTLMCGTYLAHRWKEGKKRRLYYLADDARGFFIEVGHNAHDRRAVVLRSFVSIIPLQEYAQGVRLPD
jgi:hypothetical protein